MIYSVSLFTLDLKSRDGTYPEATQDKLTRNLVSSIQDSPNDEEEIRVHRQAYSCTGCGLCPHTDKISHGYTLEVTHIHTPLGFILLIAQYYNVFYGVKTLFFSRRHLQCITTCCHSIWGFIHFKQESSTMDVLWVSLDLGAKNRPLMLTFFSSVKWGRCNLPQRSGEK